MKKQKTAVEWLHEELNQRIDYIPIKYWDKISEIFKEALEREKWLHEVTWISSGNGLFQDISFEQYYFNLKNGIIDANI
jgi:hypothetical protein